MIFNAGLDLMGTAAFNTNFLNFVRLSTDNTPPAETDNTVTGQVAASSTDGVGGERGATADYLYRRVSKRFAAGSASGANLAKCFVSSASTGTPFAGDLLRDGGGNPVTITLEADEVLDVVVELRQYLPAQDQTTTATIDGVSTTITMRRSTFNETVLRWADYVGYACRIGTSDSNYGHPSETLPAANTQWFAGAASNPVLTYDTYVPGSYTLVFNMAYGLTLGNFAGLLGAIRFAVRGAPNTGQFSPVGPWAFGFDPPLNKTAARTAAIKVSFTWGRYTP